MFNLSDKELDRLSREAADAYEVENNASSWDALEQQLDKELGTSPNTTVTAPRGFTFPFAYSSLIILLVGTSYFFLKSGKNSSTDNKKNYSVSDTNKNQTPADNPSKEIATDKATSTENDKSIVATDDNAITKNNAAPAAKESADDKKKEDLIKEKEEKSNSGAISAKPGNRNSSEKNNEGSLTGTAANNTLANKPSIINNNKRYNNKKQISNEGIATGSLKKKGNSGSLNKSDKENNSGEQGSTGHYSTIAKNNSGKSPNRAPAEEENFKYTLTSGTKPAAKHSAVVISDAALRAETTKNQAIAHLNKKNKSLYTNRSLQIGFSFAPDFSKVKYAYDDNRIGSNIGITFGYQLLNHLSVNTGLIYEHKYYQVSGEDFHLQKPYAYGALANVHIDFVNGSCNVLEIPLNIRYDVSTEGNTVFFVNGGVSSYLMLNQSYSYYCHDNNYLGYPQRIKQSYDAAQNFWFSMLNLSVGFETSISNSVSFQVDPYVKLPLRGVGIGNIQLSSYGINFAVKYSPVLKKSRH